MHGDSGPRPLHMGCRKYGRRQRCMGGRVCSLPIACAPPWLARYGSGARTLHSIPALHPTIPVSFWAPRPALHCVPHVPRGAPRHPGPAVQRGCAVHLPGRQRAPTPLPAAAWRSCLTAERGAAHHVPGESSRAVVVLRRVRREGRHPLPLAPCSSPSRACTPRRAVPCRPPCMRAGCGSRPGGCDGVWCDMACRTRRCKSLLRTCHRPLPGCRTRGPMPHPRRTACSQPSKPWTWSGRPSWTGEREGVRMGRGPSGGLPCGARAARTLVILGNAEGGRGRAQCQSLGMGRSPTRRRSHRAAGCQAHGG